MTPTKATAFRTALWQAVVDINQRLHIADYRLDPDVIAVIRAHHASLRAGLDALVAARNLVASPDGGYWFEVGCRVPDGCAPPLFVLQPRHGMRAGLREHTARSMPADIPAPLPPTPPQNTDRFKFLEFPSRLGNTLRWRDGRITDLQNNPIDLGNPALPKKEKA